MLWGNTSKIIIGLHKNASSFSLAGGLGSHMSRLTTACNNLVQVDSERLNGRWSHLVEGMLARLDGGC